MICVTIDLSKLDSDYVSVSGVSGERKKIYYFWLKKKLLLIREIGEWRLIKEINIDWGER